MQCVPGSHGGQPDDGHTCARCVGLVMLVQPKASFSSRSLQHHFCLQSELLQRLEKERPRNHLDMRHRLDKDGKRYGKVIDYR